MIKHSKELTAEAINIFGDIVHSAYHHVQRFDNEHESETERRLMRSVSIDFAIKDGVIEAESSFVIQFTNGKQVLFDVSEWMMIKAYRRTNGRNN